HPNSEEWLGAVMSRGITIQHDGEGDLTEQGAQAFRRRRRGCAEDAGTAGCRRRRPRTPAGKPKKATAAVAVGRGATPGGVATAFSGRMTAAPGATTIGPCPTAVGPTLRGRDTEFPGSIPSPGSTGRSSWSRADAIPVGRER